MSPRKNKRQQADNALNVAAARAGVERVETWRGQNWQVRVIPGGARRRIAVLVVTMKSPPTRPMWSLGHRSMEAPSSAVIGIPPVGGREIVGIR